MVYYSIEASALPYRLHVQTVVGLNTLQQSDGHLCHFSFWHTNLDYCMEPIRFKCHNYLMFVSLFACDAVLGLENGDPMKL